MGTVAGGDEPEDPLKHRAQPLHFRREHVRGFSTNLLRLQNGLHVPSVGTAGVDAGKVLVVCGAELVALVARTGSVSTTAGAGNVLDVVGATGVVAVTWHRAQPLHRLRLHDLGFAIALGRLHDGLHIPVGAV